jgi:hypothetical protein
MKKIYQSLYRIFIIILMLAHNTIVVAQDITFTTDTAKLQGVKNFHVDATSNKVYVAIKGGVAVSTDGGLTYTKKVFDATLPNLTVNGICTFGSKVYVATNNGFYISGDSGANFGNPSIFGIVLPSKHANCVFVSTDGTLYMGTDVGFSVLTPSAAFFKNYSLSNTTGLGDAHVNNINVMNGRVFLATDYGVATALVNDTAFLNFTTANGLLNNHVNSVFATNAAIYIATDGGLSVTNGAGGYTNYTKTEGLGNNYVSDVYVTPNAIYAATDSGMSVLTNGRTRFSIFSTASGLGNLGNFIVYRSLVSGAKVYAVTDGGLSQSVTSATISSSTGGVNFCPNSMITFTVTPSDAGTSPTYQWKKNNTNVGTNSVTYIDSTLNNNDVIICTMLPSSDAINNLLVTSNSLTMKMIAQPSVALGISYIAGSHCVGDPTFTANITGGYKSLSWYKDAANFETRYVTSVKVFDHVEVDGFKIKYIYRTVTTYPSLTYIPTSAGTYRAVVTNDVGCSAKTDSFTILPNTVATIAIATTSGSSKICTGTPVTFSALATDAGGFYTGVFEPYSAVYQWKKNGVNVGTGTNLLTYSNNALNNNDVITCNLQASVLVCPDRQTNGNIAVKTSNAITMNVSNPPTVSVTATNTCTTTASLQVQGAGSGNKISWHLEGTPLFANNGVVVAGGNGEGTNLNQFTAPQNPYIGTDNSLYVPDFGNHRVLKFPSNSTTATNGVTVAGIDTAGMSLDQLSYPTSVFKDAFDYLYVADNENHRIIKFPPLSIKATNGVIVAGDISEGSALNQIVPQDVYVDGSGSIYVADGDNNRILKFPSNSTASTNGTVIAGGNGRGTALNQLGSVLLFTFDATTPNMYVSDVENHRILKFPTTGNATTNGLVVAGGNGAGAALNQLNFPTTARLDARGNLFVGDAYNYRVMVFPPNSTSATMGTVIAGGHGRGTALNQLDTIEGITLDHFGDLFVSDSKNNRILKFARVGNNPFSPTVKGNYTAFVMDNASYCATTATQSIALTLPAVITVQPPASTTAYVGFPTHLSVTATGDGLTYHWTKLGSTPLTNATSATYNIAAATPTHTGNYVVTVGSSCGAQANSAVAFLTVLAAVLPLELLDFKATPSVSGNLLTWTTTHEVNNKGFNIEWLMDNGEWLILGFVKSKDGVNAVSTYDFTDNLRRKDPTQHVQNTNYYRLRQIDNDGKEALSKVVSVSTKGNTKLKVYPSVTTDILTIETAEIGNFQIINVLGQQLMTGKAPRQIDVSAWSQGTYIVKMGEEQVKFVKQ